MSEEEKANVNPIRRRTLGFKVEEGYLRTISPIKAPNKSTTPEEDEIPVRIWPAKPARVTAAPAQQSQVPAQVAVTRNVIQDTITRGVPPAVPVVLVSLGGRRRLEEEYVNEK